MADKIYGIGDICDLSDLKVGQVGRLIKFNNDDKALRRRLLDMGLTKGVLIEIKMISPLGDPIGIMLRGYQLCLRKDDIKNIKVCVTKDFIKKGDENHD